MTEQGAPLQAGPLEQVLNNLSVAGTTQRVSLGDIIEAAGDTSFLAVQVVPALLVVSPLSGIPVFSSVCGLTIAFVAVQMLMRRSALWLPGVLTRRAIPRRQLRRATRRIRGVARWIDRNATGHASWIMAVPVRRFCQVACLACGLAMPFLELVPFSSSLLGMTVILLTVALLARDALFMGLALILMAGALSIPVFVIRALAA